MDPHLAPHFEWDAQKIMKHEGAGFTCVYTEPWTTEAFWDFRVHLPTYTLFL